MENVFSLSLKFNKKKKNPHWSVIDFMIMHPAGQPLLWVTTTTTIDSQLNPIKGYLPERICICICKYLRVTSGTANCHIHVSRTPEFVCFLAFSFFLCRSSASFVWLGQVGCWPSLGPEGWLQLIAHYLGPRQFLFELTAASQRLSNASCLLPADDAVLCNDISCALRETPLTLKLTHFKAEN